ncbi:molecular chaperone DjiA [Hyphobacterium sp. CCMP332]|jgi:DnaJ like chaperone protein|uniref:molecular chaperone DjiA n=1 Tax=Hyphobacterium sp. CCMP332 TaxID=2749086 RepID=UPI00164F6217|nr:molecular chaperone DjiA [Hyphobacterium sp. CCMP332]QNL18245.1 molecular chaperone DjiA [Hyphobacterium sp. CCMP332]
MGFWRKLTDFISGQPDPYDCEGEDCGPGHRVDDADFAIALIGLGAKMAKADGVVTRNEIAAFRQVFKAPPDGEDILIRVFNLAKETTLGFDGYASRLARRFRHHPAVLEDVIDGLFHIAKADGAVTGDELDYLQAVSDIFGFSAREFRRMRMSHGLVDASDPYVILDVDPDADDAELKQAYRKMAARNHPDALMARGVPAELQRLAVEKMAAINAAYAEVRDERAAESP